LRYVTRPSSGPKPAAPPAPTGSLTASVRTLLTRDGNSADHALAAASLCEQLSEHLARLVGRAGIRALFDRSAVLTQAEFPWLAGVATRSKDPPWARLREALEGQPRDVALDGSTLLITTFVELLGRLIGEDLVLRLLHEIWPDAFAPAAQRTAKKEPT
jgi:hypothetical protein